MTSRSGHHLGKRVTRGIDVIICQGCSERYNIARTDEESASKTTVLAMVRMGAL